MQSSLPKHKIVDTFQELLYARVDGVINNELHLMEWSA
jgi:hypothetical protein